jgi:hypothetical protein
MYDQIRDLPLLIREKIYGYLSHSKYEKNAYIFLKTLQKEASYDATFFSCGLLSEKTAKILEEYSIVNRGRKIIEYVHVHRYAQNEVIMIDKVIYDPKEIESLVNLLGRRYKSSDYDLLDILLQYIFYDDIEMYGINSNGEPNKFIQYDDVDDQEDDHHETAKNELGWATYQPQILSSDNYDRLVGERESCIPNDDESFIDEPEWE